MVEKDAAGNVARDDALSLAENKSTYIPVGTKHRLENRPEEPPFIVKAPSGGDFGEVDIVRFEDLYKRE